ncbi:MAG: DUF5916 domain-containing protein [Bacteroidota bacterium]|nr:DUF5916 domain-containing protein [Bacteroidota bacterium]MDP4194335.1 DUF5916 domain-containing protein [Bacteroidota bacterium]
MRIILLLLLMAIGVIKASEPPDNLKFISHVEAFRTEEKITIDAILSEAVWKGPGCTGFIQQDPIEGCKPSQRSEVWIRYDDEAIYFAARYYDTNPDSIFARLVRRDYIWGDPSDGCVLYLDSYGDKTNGYFFYVSAAGALADGLIENDLKQPNDLTWDAVWDGAARIDSEGWTVEMKIPYSQLRFKDGSSQNWGVNVERFISRAAETDMLAFTPRNESGFTSRFPELKGLQSIKPPRRLEIMPYITGKAEYIGNDTNDPFNPGHKYLPGAGLDIRAGIGRSLTLNATINPDFGQVEVDPAVVNLTDVESSYEEKRPFFTEGVTIFRFGRGGINDNITFNWTSPNIFYSRRIGRAPQGNLPQYDYADVPSGTHILGAAKLSGKISNDWRIGTIHAITKREFAQIDLSGERSSIEIEPLSYYGVLRAQRDYNFGRQGLGAFATFTNRFFNDRELQNSINKDALVAAMDGWTNLDKEGTFVLNAWAAVSRVSGSENRMISLQRGSGHYFQRPDASYLKVDSSATSMTGYAGRIVVNKNRGPVVFNAALGLMSPEFEINDLGFNLYSDLINAHLYTGYRWNTPTSIYQNAGIFLAAFTSYDFGGNRTAQGYYTAGSLTFPNLYGISISNIYYPETYNNRRTRGGPLTLNPVSRYTKASLYTDSRLWMVLNLSGYARTGEDADSYSASTTLEIKVTPTLTVQFGPTYTKDDFGAQWVTSYADLSAKNTYSRRYVFAHLDQTTLSMDTRADWIISPKLSMQLYLQPLISTGKYSFFKELRRSKTYEFLKYGEEGSSLITKTNGTGELTYTFDADGQGPAVSKTIDNPDFRYLSLRGSAVLRWEYMPGSTIYLVWTQSRQDYSYNGDFDFGQSMNTIFDVHPDNIFMVKISYWL